SWAANSPTTLYNAVYANGATRFIASGIRVNGIRIGISLVDCANPSISQFEVNGFTPDMVAPTGPGLPGNFNPSANWIEGIRVTGSTDVSIDHCRGDHNGSVIVIGTSERVSINNIYGVHMHDNLVYVSSADYVEVHNVYGDFINGSIVKARGSHTRVTHVHGRRAGIGVTVSPYNNSGTLPASKKAGTDVVVDGVSVISSVMGVLADTFAVGADQGFLENVSISNVRLQNMLGDTSSIPIRVATSGNAKVENFDIIGHFA